MKVLVIGGMHGNEPLGIALVKLLQERPLEGVDAILANEQAIDQQVRFTAQDLNRSFPGDKNGGYEARRAAQLLTRCVEYDLVFDFHNTHCPDNDCGFVGQTAAPELYAVATVLGLRRIVVADYDCINKYAANCLSVEISLSSARNDPAVWYRQLRRLAGLQKVATAKQLPATYRFVYRLTLEDCDRLGLRHLKLKAFRPLPSAVADQLGVNSPAYPIFIGDAYTPYNYGGLLNDLEL